MVNYANSCHASSAPLSLALAGNRLSKGVTVDWPSQLGAASVLPDLEERQIENLILHGQVSEKTRALILQQLATAPVAKSVAIGQPATEQQPHQSIPNWCCILSSDTPFVSG